jgi:epoxide hydrolase-like predicted phosphatase
MTTGADRAVVFDFGGVLITSIDNQVGDVARSHGVDTSVMHEVLLGPQTSGADHPWHRAERGELAIDDIQSRLGPWADAVDVTLRGDEMERLLAPGGYTVVDSMIDEVRRLRSVGVATALLTNTFAEFRPTMQRDIDFELFDVVVESFAVGARKPELEIYRTTADMLGIGHEEIVYLDDFAHNLAPAAELGWATILVDDPHVAVDELRAALARSGYDRK